MAGLVAEWERKIEREQEKDLINLVDDVRKKRPNKIAN